MTNFCHRSIVLKASSHVMGLEALADFLGEAVGLLVLFFSDALYVRVFGSCGSFPLGDVKLMSLIRSCGLKGSRRSLWGGIHSLS